MKYIYYVLIFLGTAIIESIINSSYGIKTHGLLHSVFAPGICLFLILMTARKTKRISQQEKTAATRRNENMKELEVQLLSKHYTNAEIEHLIYTADLSNGQKDILRRRHLNTKT